MKLYYSPGACSLSPHIVARELGLDVTLDRVDLKNRQTAAGADYLRINPKGYVPALELDDGSVLTEGSAIVQYLADHPGGNALAPANGTLARARLQEMLGYISTELHKSYSPLFSPATPDSVREERKAYLHKRYGLVEQVLASQPFLLGEEFSVADAYLFTITNWAAGVGLDLTPFPKLQDFQQRVAQRPAVQAAMSAEGLVGKQQAA